MRTFTKKQTAATAAITVVLLGGGTAAYAYWTSTGTGYRRRHHHGRQRRTSRSTRSAPPPRTCTPAAPARQSVVEVTNNAPNNAYVPPSPARSASPAIGCDPTDYTFDPAGRYAGSRAAVEREFTMTWTAVDLEAGALAVHAAHTRSVQQQGRR